MCLSAKAPSILRANANVQDLAGITNTIFDAIAAMFCKMRNRAAVFYWNMTRRAL